MSRLVILIAFIAWTLTGMVVFNHQDMRLFAEQRIRKSPVDFSGIRYVLVLGAGRNYANAHPNFAFIGRMDATAQFARQHPAITYILSGNADHQLYNEPLDMYHALQQRGITNITTEFDESAIDTYTSVIHFKNQHGAGPVVLISQEEHLRRAIWMANHEGIEAYGYTAGGFPGGTPRWFRWREYAASMKARLRTMGVIQLQEQE